MFDAETFFLKGLLVVVLVSLFESFIVSYASLSPLWGIAAGAFTFFLLSIILITGLMIIKAVKPIADPNPTKKAAP